MLLNLVWLDSYDPPLGNVLQLGQPDCPHQWHAFQKSLDQRSDHINSRYNLSQIYVIQKEHQKAVFELLKVKNFLLSEDFNSLQSSKSKNWDSLKGRKLMEV